MLETLSQKFNKVLRYLRNEAKITEENIKVALKDIKLSLLEADVNFKVVKKFIDNIKEKSLGQSVQESLNPYQQMVKVVKDEIEIILGNQVQDLKDNGRKPGVIMMVGLQGTGKTTTAGKLAYFLKEQGKNSLLASMDLKRLAAQEQLEIIANEINGHFYHPKGNKINDQINDLIRQAKDFGYDYLIVDTAGRLHIDEELMQELLQIKKGLNPDEIIFVADALTGQDAVNSALAFSQSIGIDSIILTKLDADSRGGTALSIVSVTEKPIKFVGLGEKFQDLQKFYPDRMASKILGLGDVLTLIEKAEKEFDSRQTEQIARKMLSQEFTLDDFLSQLKQMQKLGSMNDIVSMLPNAGFMKGIGQTNIDEKKIKHMMAIIQSMTQKERNYPKIVDGRRRYRISRGSGRPVPEVNQLLKQYFEVKKVMKKPFFRKLLKKIDFSNKMS